MERAGRGERFAQFWRLQPRTYLQAWLYAVLSIGVPGLIAWALATTDLQRQILALGCPVGIVVSGLAQSWYLHQRKREGR